MITVEPMGNMPVIRDLIVDMDAVHWKKIQRVTPWLINKEPVPEREYIVPHENMVDVTQTMACIQCGACVSDCLSMEVDPLFVGPAALAKAYRFVGDPRDAEHRERLKDLSEDQHGIYDCTHCFNCIDACPKGVDPMSQIMRLRRDRRAPTTRSRTATTATATSTRSSRTSARTACCTRPTCCRLLRRQVPPARGAGADQLAADGVDGAVARQDDAEDGARAPAQGARRRSSGSSTTSRAASERNELNLYVTRIRGRGRDRGRRGDLGERKARPHEGRLLARLREPRVHAGAARIDGRRSRRCSTSS